MDKLTLAEQTLVKEEVPAFKAGDTVNVYYRVREGEKERIQQFEGVVISRRGSGPNETFTCRKISFGNIGVERIFLIHSPFIAKIEVVKEGVVRRSKLYYLRELQGKAARIKEKERWRMKDTAARPKEETNKKEAALREDAEQIQDEEEHSGAQPEPEAEQVDSEQEAVSENEESENEAEEQKEDEKKVSASEKADTGKKE